MKVLPRATARIAAVVAVASIRRAISATRAWVALSLLLRRQRRHRRGHLAV
jgi:hypothetical protein